MRASRAVIALLVAMIAGQTSTEAQDFDMGGVQAWNLGYWETVSVGDYYGPNYGVNRLKPTLLAGTRNGVFSGAVLVTNSNGAISNLNCTMTELTLEGDEKTRLPANCVQIRYPELADPLVSWMPPYRFDRMMPGAPEEVEIINPYHVKAPPTKATGKPKFDQPIAMQPVWLTVRVPRDAAPGDYEGKLLIRADRMAMDPVVVPVRLSVAGWVLPDPKGFRVTNFGQSSPESLARHYNVPRWSEKHFDLMGQSMALMAEVNSRQAIIDLCLDFYGVGGVPETMVRWIRQPDGSFTYDFTVLDKYLDTVARRMGKPTLLRVNCWMEWARSHENPKPDEKPKWSGPCRVSLFDPATGKVEPLEQPRADTPEFYAFWKPVLDEVRKRIEARGWFDVTAIGANSYCWGVSPQLVDVLARIWPDGQWSYTAHNGRLGGRFAGSEKSVSMSCFHSDVIWGLGKLKPRGYQSLLKARPGYHCFTFRGWRCTWDLPAQRRIAEEEIMRSHDGVSDFGVDFFPIKDGRGRPFYLGNGRGTGGPNCSTLALLAAGPDGPMGNERFEAFREGVQIAEAILFIQKAIDGGGLPTDLAGRANALLDERATRFIAAHVPISREGHTRWDSAIHFDKAVQRENELFAMAAQVANAMKK